MTDVEEYEEPDYTEALGKAPTALQARFAAWIRGEEVGYDPNSAKNKLEAFTEGVRLGVALRIPYQASNHNREATEAEREERAAARQQAMEAREAERAEKQAAREAAAAERAQKAAEKAAAKAAAPAEEDDGTEEAPAAKPRKAVKGKPAKAAAAPTPAAAPATPRPAARRAPARRAAAAPAAATDAPF